MNHKEAKLFEEELAGDPSLQAESNFQREIITGLKDYRKAQLKADLDAIDLSPKWFEPIQQSAFLKSLGGVALATLIGTGIYLVVEPELANSENQNVVIDAPGEFKVDIDWKIVPAVLSEKQMISETDNALVQSEKSMKEIPRELEDLDIDTINTKPFSLTFNAPSAKDVKDDEALKTSALDNLSKKIVPDLDTEPINVNHENTKTLKIKYKYYDGKLFLSGDFDKAPYEILEINSTNGRRIYVKYLEKFYEVGVTDKLTTLPELTDVEVIKELNLLRQNK
ncbi:MAG: hypothetical protein AAGC64_08870 [Bacteroidota bacterium]